MASNGSAQFIGMIEKWFAKLPPLPGNWRDVIVNITPYLALIFGILGLLGSLVAVGVLTVLSPFIALGQGIGAASGGVVGAVLAFVSSALLLAAFPGTRQRKMPGWRLLFWSETVSVVSSVVAVNVGGVAGGLIGFYILFQIKSHYK